VRLSDVNKSVRSDLIQKWLSSMRRQRFIPYSNCQHDSQHRENCLHVVMDKLVLLKYLVVTVVPTKKDVIYALEASQTSKVKSLKMFIFE
jgi:hypothetical protein